MFLGPGFAVPLWVCSNLAQPTEAVNAGQNARHAFGRCPPYTANL